MADVVIAEFMDPAAVEQLAAEFRVLFDATLHERPAELCAVLPEARALIVRNRTQVKGAVLDAGGRLEAIGRLGVGLDNIDLEACRARGIAVLPATGANDQSVAEYVLAAALILIRGAFFATEAVCRGAWPRERLIGHELGGRRIGLVGFGAIGRLVARKARALEMTVAAFDPHIDAADPAWAEVARCRTLEELLASADVVSIHVPLLPGTRGLIGDAAIGCMKPHAILINTARGGVVDDAALVGALREGRLAGAALDVFEQEPLTEQAARRFANTPNLLLTPHIAGITWESNARVSAVTAAAVRRVLAQA